MSVNLKPRPFHFIDLLVCLGTLSFPSHFLSLSIHPFYSTPTPISS